MGDTQRLWMNRFKKFNELVATVVDFKSSEDNYTDYSQFLLDCIQTLEGLKTMIPHGKVGGARIEDEEGICPPEFLCPLSNKIMKDPVVVESGETYDRDSITELLKTGKKCPLSSLEIDGSLMFPNIIIKDMIMVWSSRNSGGPFRHSSEIELTLHEKNNIERIVQNLTSLSSPHKRRDAQRLRALTKYKASHRRFFDRSSMVSELVNALLLKEGNGEGFEEDMLHTVHNVSLHDPNKRVLGGCTMLILLLVSGLRPEKSESIRSISASTLRRLSHVDSNKEEMGGGGVVKALLDVLKRGDSRLCKDAAICLRNLCQTSKNIERLVAEGGVELLFAKISTGDEEWMVQLVNIMENITMTNRIAGKIWRNITGVELFASFIESKETDLAVKHSCMGCLNNIIGYDLTARKALREKVGFVTVIEDVRKDVVPPMVKEKAKKLLNGIKSQNEPSLS